MKKVGIFFLILCVFFLETKQCFSFQNENSAISEIKNLELQANGYLEKAKKDSLYLDSSFKIMKSTRSLSNTISYDTGLVNSLVLEYQIIVRKIEAKITKEENVDDLNLKLVSIEEDLLKIHSPKNQAARLGVIFTKLANARDDYVKQTYTEKIKMFEKALAVLEGTDEFGQMTNLWYRTGYTHHVNSQLEKAEEAYLKSISIAEENGVSEVQHVYGILGNIYAFRGSFNRALKYELDALRLAEKNNDSLTIGNIHLYLGLIYGGFEDRELAMVHYRKAFQEFEKYKIDHLNDLTNTTSNIARLLVPNDPARAVEFLDNTISKHPEVKESRSYMGLIVRYMQAYYKLGDLKKAQFYADQVIESVEKSNNQGHLSTLLRYLVDTKQYEEAEYFLPRFRTMVMERKESKYISESYYFRYRIDSGRDNFNLALENYLKYDSVNNEIFSEKQANQISELKIEYELEQKEKDIDLLQKQSIINQNEVEKATLVRNGAGLGILLLIIIASLLYNSSRAKNKNNKKLKHLLFEKEILLKEVHHRVKNNLQTVLSLLESQSRNLDKDAFLAISETQNRVFTMSLIHKKLYQTDSVAAIEIKDYLGDLLQHLKESYLADKTVAFEFHIDSILMDVSQAVPIGLIVNEAVTNSLKHAFIADNPENKISVELREVGNYNIVLKIEDNGIGFVKPVKNSSGGLGMKLIKGLTEDINGEFSFNSSNGFVIEITFRLNAPLNKIEGTQINMSA